MEKKKKRTNNTIAHRFAIYVRCLLGLARQLDVRDDTVLTLGVCSGLQESTPCLGRPTRPTGPTGPKRSVEAVYIGCPQSTKTQVCNSLRIIQVKVETKK